MVLNFIDQQNKFSCFLPLIYFEVKYGLELLLKASSKCPPKSLNQLNEKQLNNWTITEKSSSLCNCNKKKCFERKMIFVMLLI